MKLFENEKIKEMIQEIPVKMEYIIIILILISFLLYYIVKYYKIKKKILNLKMLELKCNLITDLANDIIFEYDIKTDVLKLSMPFPELFEHYKIISLSAHEEMISKIHIEDRSIYESFLHELQVGEKEIHKEFRITTKNDTYWFEARGKVLLDKTKPKKIIGKFVDITKHRKKVEYLKTKAEKDFLTNTYNKTTTEELIEEIIKNSKDYEKHALFMLDIDDFKKVNDQYGHLMGDKILKAIGSQISSIFREEDVVGRIGGDEFVIFMRQVSSLEEVSQKAETLSKIFHHVSVDSQNCPVSGSIGIAMYPNDGETYKKLVHRADQALYKIKQTGKNNYSFYRQIGGDSCINE